MLIGPKIIFLEAAEFSSEQDLWTMKMAIKIFLEMKVENCTILTFKVNFLCQNSSESDFFLLNNIKKETKF